MSSSRHVRLATNRYLMSVIISKQIGSLTALTRALLHRSRNSWGLGRHAVRADGTTAESRNAVSSISCEKRKRTAAVTADAALPLFPATCLLIMNRLTMPTLSCGVRISLTLMFVATHSSVLTIDVFPLGRSEIAQVSATASPKGQAPTRMPQNDLTRYGYNRTHVLESTPNPRNPKHMALTPNTTSVPLSLVHQITPDPDSDESNSATRTEGSGAKDDMDHVNSTSRNLTSDSTARQHLIATIASTDRKN
jgi:hypothetical protein